LRSARRTWNEIHSRFLLCDLILFFLQAYFRVKLKLVSLESNIPAGSKADEREQSRKARILQYVDNADSPAQTTEQWMRLLREGEEDNDLEAPSPLSQCLESVDSPAGRQRLKDYLKTRPFPHYETTANHPGLLIRINEDGSRTLGRFVNRRFEERQD
jgi:hypothetical protein